MSPTTLLNVTKKKNLVLPHHFVEHLAAADKVVQMFSTELQCAMCQNSYLSFTWCVGTNGLCVLWEFPQQPVAVDHRSPEKKKTNDKGFNKLFTDLFKRRL